MQHTDPKLYILLPEPRNVEHNLRHIAKYEPPKLRILRAMGSLVNWALCNLQ